MGREEYLSDKYLYSSATLKEKQAWDYDKKVQVCLSRVMEFVSMNNHNVCVAFSGGADSTVLLDMVCFVWSLFKIKEPLTVLYSNTTNEFAVMPKHAKKQVQAMRDKYEIEIDFQELRPKKSFVEIVKTEGYPVGSKKVSRMVSDIKKGLKKANINYKDIEDKLDDGLQSAEYLRQFDLPDGVILYLTGITGKNFTSNSWKLPKKWRKLIDAPFDVTSKCCNILKKEPMKAIEKETKKGVFIGTMAIDSSMREQEYRRSGCIVFSGKTKKCTPMGYWLEQDKMRYLVEHELEVAPVYGEIKQRENGDYYFSKEDHTGCKLCLFGCEFDTRTNDKNRIQRLKDIEPATYKFAMKPISEGGLGYKEVMDYIGIESNVEE